MPQISNSKKYFHADYDRFIAFSTIRCNHCKVGALVFEYIKILPSKIVFTLNCSRCIGEQKVTCTKDKMKRIINNLLQSPHSVPYAELFYMLRLATEVDSVHYSPPDKKIFDEYVKELENWISKRRKRKWSGLTTIKNHFKKWIPPRS